MAIKLSDSVELRGFDDIDSKRLLTIKEIVGNNIKAMGNTPKEIRISRWSNDEPFQEEHNLRLDIADETMAEVYNQSNLLIGLEILFKTAKE